MGRMFDVLTQADEHHGRNGLDAPEPPTVLVPAPPALFDPDPEPEDERVPFIEVGGPRDNGGAKVLPPPRHLATPPPVSQSSDVLAFRFQLLAAWTGPAAPESYAPELVAWHRPDHAASRHYRELADALRRQSNGPGPSALLFTATGPAVGTTTIVLNLAITLAREAGSRVVVVDANLARPGVAGRLSLAPEPGLREVLGRSVPLAWVLQPTAVDGLTGLSAGRTSGESAAVPGVEALPDVIDRLRRRFDWVLIDTAPWDARPEAALLAEHCDGVYLVARQEQIDTAETEDAQLAIRQQGGQVRGLVLTKM